MATYRYLPGETTTALGVNRIEDGAYIPHDATNYDWQVFEASGEIPEPAETTESPLRPSTGV